MPAMCPTTLRVRSDALELRDGVRWRLPTPDKDRDSRRPEGGGITRAMPSAECAGSAPQDRHGAAISLALSGS
jgi:hypothetical protein